MSFYMALSLFFGPLKARPIPKSAIISIATLSVLWTLAMFIVSYTLTTGMSQTCSSYIADCEINIEHYGKDYYAIRRGITASWVGFGLYALLAGYSAKLAFTDDKWDFYMGLKSTD
jgi:hypothetical protein